MYKLTAERSDGIHEPIPFGLFDTMEAAREYVEKLDLEEKWPVSYDAMLLDEATGIVYMYVDSWEVYIDPTKDN